MVRLSPSSSEVSAEQVKVEEVTSPVLGLIETVVTSGSELSTVTDAEPVSVAPASSVAVAVQVMVLPSAAVAAVRVMLAPEPRDVDLLVLVHA